MTDKMTQRFIAARKAYIQRQFTNLNQAQQEAVLTTEGPLLLLAGAGSGKTTVLINRIANLIRFGRGSDTNEIPDTITDEDVLFLESINDESSETDRFRADYMCSVEPPRPWNVLVITFTNKAANELKDRLSAMLGNDATDVWAMTFHSACCRILRRDIERLGYTGSFTIYDQSDSERVMKGIIQDLGLDEKTLPAKYVLNIISREKDRMVSPEMMLYNTESSTDFRMRYITKAYQQYQKKLKENNALDFDDIVFKTVELLQQNEDLRIHYQQKFKYVLVDEYQDTNHLQYLLISILAGGYENICVVGDDDQSIYRFRGATIENILDFENQYRGSRVIRLEQNYRSTQSILHAANAVISNNLGRKGKRLWTENSEGEPITVYEAADEGAEGNYIANQIISGHNKNAFKDYAILYRTNAQSNALEFALKRSGVPYRVIGGTRFFDRAEVKDMLAYLCVINNRTDDLRLKRIVNNPPRGIGNKTVEVAERLAAAEGNGLYHVVSNPGSYGPLQKSASKLQAFTNLIEGLGDLLDQGMELPDFYEELMHRTGYVAMLEGKPTEENKGRLENVRELKSSIITYTQNSDMPTLAGFLEEIALYTDIEQYNDSDDAVVMMTMHSAKGLEFSNVFLVGFEDGLFPGMRSIGDAEEMEEERRLCYVAITRAKKTLTISYARQRMIFGKTSSSMQSRFLREIPEKLIVRKGGYLQTNSYTSRPAAKSVQPVRNYIKPVATTPAFIPEFKKGDMVQHTAFGRGMIISVLKMGNDALLEVAFDKIGTKKLMAKAAAAHMKHI